MIMIKRKNLSAAIMLILMFNALLACQGSSVTSATDSLTTAPMDSMPVIKPTIADSAGIITTPPVNDDNNIIPNSSH